MSEELENKYDITFPVYVVYVEDQPKFASEDYDDCENYIGALEEDDLSYIEEEFGISEDDSPKAAQFMAGYYGDAQGAEIITINENNVDEDAEEVDTFCGTLSLSQLQDLLQANDEMEEY